MVCASFYKKQTVFPKGVAILRSYLQQMRVPFAPHTYQHLLLSIILMSAILFCCVFSHIMQMEDVYFYVTHFVVLFDFFLLNLEFNFKIKRGWTAQQGISTKHYAQ